MPKFKNLRELDISGSTLNAEEYSNLQTLSHVRIVDVNATLYHPSGK